MGARSWVCRDPARREQLLGLLRAAPRVTVCDLALKMMLSTTCVRSLLNTLKAEGKVDTALDITMRRTPRSGAPLVAWLITTATKRLGKRLKPRLVGFMKCAYGAYVHPYAPSGTPVHMAGCIQLIAVQGRQT